MRLNTWTGDAYTGLTWDEWRRQGWRFAGGLRQLGIREGERVACIMTNTPGACTALLGTWLAGACLVSLPTVARGMVAHHYAAQLQRIIAQADPSLLVVDSEHLEFVTSLGLGVTAAVYDAIDSSKRVEASLAAPEQPVLVQYSSGSTRTPRGCVLSAGAIAAQLDALQRALQIDPASDSCMSWLPLSHDMGLIGCFLMTFYWSGIPVTLSTPHRFLTCPLSWLRDCAQFGSTITAGPDFAVDLVARAHAAPPPAPLPLRSVVIGGERVRATTLEKASTLLERCGVARTALTPAYGLAEAVLAVTVTPPDEEPTIITVEADELATGTVRSVAGEVERECLSYRRLVSAGRPLPGLEVASDGPDRLSEISVRGATLADGYLADPDLTTTRFGPEGLRTSDVGFMRDGHLYVTGRTDDLMTVAGRNVYATDIEDALSSCGYSRPGACAVVQIDTEDDPRLVAVMEPVDDHPDLAVMAEGAVAAARATAGVQISECIFLPRGLFPRTPSGKAQRYRCRELATESASHNWIRSRVRTRPDLIGKTAYRA